MVFRASHLYFASAASSYTSCFVLEKALRRRPLVCHPVIVKWKRGQKWEDGMQPGSDCAAGRVPPLQQAPSVLLTMNGCENKGLHPHSNIPTSSHDISLIKSVITWMSVLFFFYFVFFFFIFEHRLWSKIKGNVLCAKKKSFHWCYSSGYVTFVSHARGPLPHRQCHFCNNNGGATPSGGFKNKPVLILKGKICVCSDTGVWL